MTDEHDLDCCMETETETILDKTIDLLHKLNLRDVTYVMALLKSPCVPPTETNADVAVDETVYSINRLLDTLPARQRIYAMESLQYTMNHHFEKNMNKGEIMHVACEMIDVVLQKLEYEKNERSK